MVEGPFVKYVTQEAGGRYSHLCDMNVTGWMLGTRAMLCHIDFFIRKLKFHKFTAVYSIYSKIDLLLYQCASDRITHRRHLEQVSPLAKGRKVSSVNSKVGSFRPMLPIIERYHRRKTASEKKLSKQ